MKVLIVDDDEDIRETLRDMFELEGFEVETASDGIEGLSKLTSVAPAAIILDLRMPRMDGHELFRRLKETPTLSKLAVFISTSLPSIAPAGAMVVPKPIDAARLVRLVRQACASIPQ